MVLVLKSFFIQIALSILVEQVVLGRTPPAFEIYIDIGISWILFGMCRAVFSWLVLIRQSNMILPSLTNTDISNGRM